MQAAVKGNNEVSPAKNPAIKTAKSPPPQELNLLPLLRASPRLRADLLFYTRLAGTYCQTIFRQAFAPAAKIRRKTLFNLAQTEITGQDFKDAILNPQRRNAQSIDMLHYGFVKLLQALQKQPKPQPSPAQGQTESIAEIFSRGLRQRHGLPWNMADFIRAIEILVRQRGFLEHFAERLQNKEKGKAADIPSPYDNAEFFRALSLLLLPQFCQEIESRISRIKNTSGRENAQAAAAAIFSYYKEERKQGIKEMFSEARARKTMFAKGQEKTKSGKYKNKTLQSRALLNGEWRKYYLGLKLAKTDFRENTFKRHYDFIGKQNFRQLYRLLGADLNTEKLKKIDSENPQKAEYCLYASEGKRPSFRNEIVPLYICVMRLQAQICFCFSFAPRKKGDKIIDPLLKHIRNHLAHNGLFWQIPDPKPQGAVSALITPAPARRQIPDQKQRRAVLSVKQIFAAVAQMLRAQSRLNTNAPRYTEFYDSVFTILDAENCPLWHNKPAADAPPHTRKIPRQTLRRKPRLQKNLKAENENETRILLRRVLRQWQKNLKQARNSLAL